MVVEKGKALSPGRPGRPRRNASSTEVAASTSLPFSPRSRSPIKRSTSASRIPVVNKSPSRQSPSRKSPSRTMSPARKTPAPKSPARKSPSRKIPKKKEENIEPSSRRLRSLDIDTDSDTIENALPEKEKPKARVRGRRRDDDDYAQEIKINEVTIPLERITRSPAPKEVERIFQLKNTPLNTINKKLAEFSDDDDTLQQQQQQQQQAEQIRKSKSIDRKSLENDYEFGGLLGALFFIIFTPLSLIWLHLFCNELSCSFTIPPSTSKLTALSTYFHLESFLYYSAYCLLLAVLSSLPFGGKRVIGLPNKHGRLSYRMNGFASFLTILSIFIGLEYKGYRIADYIIGHMLHLLTASIVIGFYISIHAFIRSYYVPLHQLNLNVSNKNKIYGFFMGREVNPRVFRVLDLKMYVFRLALIGAILLDLIYLYKSMGGERIINNWKSIELNGTLTTLVLFRLIYFLDGLILESTWVTSFEIQYEGFGFMGGVGYSIYPFMTVAVTKYVFDYGVHLELWKMCLTVIVFITGYILFRGSNNEKNLFRNNPYSPKFQNAETIMTGQGRKLLVSGFWGIVRHPNYLGDILINLSFAPFALCVPPVLTVLSIVLLLVHRSVRDNTRCKLKYGASWGRYCERVKYVLIPKIY